MRIFSTSSTAPRNPGWVVVVAVPMGDDQGIHVDRAAVVLRHPRLERLTRNARVKQQSRPARLDVALVGVRTFVRDKSIRLFQRRRETGQVERHPACQRVAVGRVKVFARRT